MAPLKHKSLISSKSGVVIYLSSDLCRVGICEHPRSCTNRGLLLAALDGSLNVNTHLSISSLPDL